jgi:hypothetical protein
METIKTAAKKALKFIWRVWEVVRHFLALHSLLQWTGKWESISGATVAMIILIGGRIARMPWPVIVTLALVVFALVSLIWRVFHPIYGGRDKLPIPELRRNALDLARRLREFQRKYLEAGSIISNQFAQIRMLPKAEQNEAFTQYTTSQLSLSRAELFDFGPLRVEAINMRRDLLDVLHEKFGSCPKSVMAVEAL